MPNNTKQDAFVDDSITKLIDELQHRQVYGRLDARILASIPDYKVELAIVDYVHTKLEAGHEDEAAILAKLPAGARALYLTWGVEIEVINGGFNRYYRNRASRFADEAVAAFEFFSAHKHAELMREANRSRAEQGAVAVVKFRDDPEMIEVFSETHLEDRFYKLEERLSALRIAKIRSSPALFSGD